MCFLIGFLLGFALGRQPRPHQEPVMVEHRIEYSLN